MMKKLMVAAFAVMAMVGAAQAAPSYGIEANGFVKPYSLDTAPGNTHASWYSGYVMKQEDAQKAMGCVGTEVTYSGMAEWLGKNFADNKKSVIDNAERLSYWTGWISPMGQYKLMLMVADQDSPGVGVENAIGVFFYDDGANVAYNVVLNDSPDSFEFSDKSRDSSGWTAATMASVPEPTSGLLLLLGMAGLALKRKRVVG